MAGSWLDRVRHWFQAEPERSGSFDPRRFEALCVENPGAALDMLRADQRELTDELENTYVAFQDRVTDLATRLSSLAPEDVRREAVELREAQDAIRRNVRRLEASAKSARDLERELGEWHERRDEDSPPHADHPAVRAEIIRSELAIRAGEPEFVAIALDESPFASSNRTGEPGDGESFEEDEDEEMTEHLPSPDADHILVAIRQGTREVERWHGAPDQSDEAVAQVYYLKELHAILKRLDREQRIRRDRLELAVQMHDSYE